MLRLWKTRGNVKKVGGMSGAAARTGNLRKNEKKEYYKK